LSRIHNCLIGKTNSEILLIFKIPNSKVDLNDTFVNNGKNSNALQFLNSSALKRYQARHLKTHLGGQILYRNLAHPKKRRQNNNKYNIQNIFF